MYFVVEYLWLDAANQVRSKVRVLRPGVSVEKFTIDYVPVWNYDGSSTGQASSKEDTEIILKPCVLYKNPLHRTDQHWLVLCDIPGGVRERALTLFNHEKCIKEEPWFGLEQEYFIFHKSFDTNKMNLSQGAFYCAAAYSNYVTNQFMDNRRFFERIIADEHLDACLYAGLNMSGLNAEVACHQWEFQVGPCVGISAADELYVATYLLQRIAEKYDCYISVCPKINKTINGSGCHVNFSTNSTRHEGGLSVILDEYIPKLSQHHSEDIKKMGDDNQLRLTGKHETSSYDKFSYGFGTRNTSIRIGNDTCKAGYGYFEDRRPAANMEPYLVTSLLCMRCLF
jgi:glutamine synthetase